jgi:hypothetical protein
MAREELKTDFQFGVYWSPYYPLAKRHRDCIQKGGRWKKSNGEMAGEGMFSHYKGLIKELWPEFDQHRWFDTMLKGWLENEFIGVAGGKDSSKSGSMATIHLADYYCFPFSRDFIDHEGGFGKQDFR